MTTVPAVEVTLAVAAAHGVAWETYLPRLAAVAAGRDPGPDPHSAAGDQA